MIYRTNEKGRCEAVRNNGDIISFESEDEMIAFAKLRLELYYLVGRKPEETDIRQATCRDMIGAEQIVSGPGKKVKTRIYKANYVLDGYKIKKALA